MTKVLMISTDREAFKPASAVRERLMALGELIDQLDVVVFSLKRLGFTPVKISGKVTVYPTNSYSRLTYIWSAVWLAAKLGRPNLITCQDPFETGLAGWVLAQWFRTGLELQIHTDFLAPAFRRESFLNRLRHFWGQWLLSEANQTRVVSERIKQSLSDHKIVLPRTPLVLPIFTTTERFSASVKTDLHQLYHQFKKIILVAARLTKEKRVDLAIKTLTELVKTDPAVGLIIAGSGPLLSELKDLARQLRVESKVVFAGQIGDLSDWYQTADLLLLTSSYEGYGLALVEAAAAGLPIVATDVGVAAEVGARIAKPEPAALAAAAREQLAIEVRKMPTTLPIASKEEYLAAISRAWHDDFSFNRGGKIKRVIKYVISGGTAAFTNLGGLYLLTDLVHLHYLISSVISFLLAFWVSFSLQKFWTFLDHSKDRLIKQIGLYFFVALVSLGANTVILFVLVQYFGIWYLLGQVIAGLIIAVSNFFVYQLIIFEV